LKSKIFFNDFERTVFNQYKVLENIKRELFKKGALFASLSGSGATIYAFFKSESNKYIHKLAQTYRKKGYFVFIN
jgi:4-diphosphocytidyl-2C-methyl-D-erythritol kinase